MKTKSDPCQYHSAGHRETDRVPMDPSVSGTGIEGAENKEDCTQNDRENFFDQKGWRRLRLILLGAAFTSAFIFTVAFRSVGQVGYMPKQPLPFDHALHAGDLKLDCFFCHDTAETARYAAIPATQRCIDCHRQIGTNNAYRLLFNYFLSGAPITWTKVYNIPDFVFFHHGAHTSAGIKCATCHGQVEKMQEVFRREAMTMKWCIDCHRKLEGGPRPGAAIGQMNANGADGAKHPFALLPSTDCSTCHR